MAGLKPKKVVFSGGKWWEVNCGTGLQTHQFNTEKIAQDFCDKVNKVGIKKYFEENGHEE